MTTLLLLIFVERNNLIHETEIDADATKGSREIGFET